MNQKDLLYGDRIIVTDVPMVGMEEHINHINRHKRISTLEIDIFNRVTEMKLALEKINKRI